MFIDSGFWGRIGKIIDMVSTAILTIPLVVFTAST